MVDWVKESQNKKYEKNIARIVVQLVELAVFFSHDELSSDRSFPRLVPNTVKSIGAATPGPYQENGMWDKIKATALVTALLVGTSAAALAQSSPMGSTPGTRSPGASGMPSTDDAGGTATTKPSTGGSATGPHGRSSTGSSSTMPRTGRDSTGSGTMGTMPGGTMPGSGAAGDGYQGERRTR